MGQKLNRFQPQPATHIPGIQGCTLPSGAWDTRDVLRMGVTQGSHPLPELTLHFTTSLVGRKKNLGWDLLITKALQNPPCFGYA